MIYLTTLFDIRTISMISFLWFLSSCNSGGGGAPGSTTNVVISADLPSNIVRLIKDGRDILAQLDYHGTSQKMNIIIDGTAEKTIENYGFSDISLSVLISVDDQGVTVPLANANKTVQMQAGPVNNIKITSYDYPDIDGDGFSNLLEIFNNTGYTDVNTFPNVANSMVINSASYSIERIKTSELNYSPSSENYTIDSTSRSIYRVPGGISHSEKQIAGLAIYKIRTD